MNPAFESAARIHIDTSPFIYFIEANPVFLGLLEPLIRAVDDGKKECTSSYVTLVEILTKPLELGRTDLAARYRDLLLRSRGLKLVALEEAVAEEAARVRARYKYRTPDAIQLAAAMRSGSDLFVTNDKRLKGFMEIPIFVLEEHI